MTDKPRLARWHWRATSIDGGGAPMQYEFDLEDLHTPADTRLYEPEQHHLCMQWGDPRFPGMGRINTRQHRVTEEFRRDAVRQSFWAEQITSTLAIEVSLAKPSERLGDDLSEDQVFRVACHNDGATFYVSRLSATGSRFSELVAADEL